jgi:ubiquinone/menaquinone biosynthesis C-methylase UbiE
MSPERHRSLIAAALVALCWTCAAQQRDPEQYAAFLESQDRVAQLQVPRVVETLGVAPGQSVADIGSGSGVFTRAFARAVGETGAVYAVDIDTALLRILERHAREEGLTNITPVHATATDPKLPRPVDLVFFCDALHHIDDRATYIERLRTSLTPGGRIAVVDFSKTWPTGHESMRYTREELDGWMKAAGFRQNGSYDFLNDKFFVIYQAESDR